VTLSAPSQLDVSMDYTTSNGTATAGQDFWLVSGTPVIPAGATYRIRGREYSYRGARVFPSYLQAGPSFFIEKSKRRMIAEDIAAALAVRG